MHQLLGDYDLLHTKGIFPYSWFDSLERLQETNLPLHEAFHDSLTDALLVSEEDYQHAQTIWTEFNCTTFADYMRLYLKCDVLQLADVFENFHGICMQEDGLDPVHFFSIPGLSWDSAFKITECHIDLLTDA